MLNEMEMDTLLVAAATCLTTLLLVVVVLLLLRTKWRHSPRPGQVR